MKSPHRILVVDDEESIRMVIAEGLKLHGFAAQTAHDADAALTRVQNETFDLAIVDLKMPGTMNGLQLLAEMRRRCPGIATIVLTGYATLESAIIAIREGASDYIRKPAEIGEIINSVQRALSSKDGHADAAPQAHPTAAAQNRFIHNSKLFIDRFKHVVLLYDKPLSLTPIEFAMLEHLVANPDHVVSARELVHAAQNYDLFEADARALIRVHIQHLREKLGDDGRKPQFILNVRGKGYRYIG